MGRLGDIMRAKYGTVEQKEKINIPESKEQSEKVKEYLKKIKQDYEPDKLNYYDVLEYFQQIYQAQNGRKFEGLDLKQVENIALYFAMDSSFNLRGQKFDLKKGLLLKGGYGVGKTSAMRAFREIKPQINFGFKSVIEIVKMFDEYGSDIIHKYAKIGEFCFDDLGTETDGKHYGKTQNVFKDIMELRYNQFKYNGTKTHISTNLNFDQFKERYGDRMASRLYEMFNVIIFEGEDYRKNL